MPSTYYSDSSGNKKALPVSAHSHYLDRTHFANVRVSQDGSVTDPKNGQGLYWIGNPPNDPDDPGAWYAGDAPTRAPVNETVLANWFEPATWSEIPTRRGYIADTVVAGDIAAHLALIEAGSSDPDIFYEGEPAAAAESGDFWYLATTQEWLQYIPTLTDPGTTEAGVAFPAGWVQIVINPDGAAGTWRPTTPVQATPGNIFSWEGPQGGNGKPGFGIASETVDGYIRLQTTSDITVEWGREVNSGARPIAYGAAGTQSSGEYVYKITVLAMALENKSGAAGPWKISVGMAFYTNNVVRDAKNAPDPCASKHIVWGVNEVDLATYNDTEGRWENTEEWVPVECFMSGRVPDTDVPLDAPLGGVKDWNDEDPDGPHDGYYFTPIIKVTGADADVLIDSVQVMRGAANLLVPRGITTTTVIADQIASDEVVTDQLTLNETDEIVELLPVGFHCLDDNVDDLHDEFTSGYGLGYAFPQSPAVVPALDKTIAEFTPNPAPEQDEASARWLTETQRITFEAGLTYTFEAVVSASAGSPGFRLGAGFIDFSTPTTAPDGTDQTVSFDWTPGSTLVDLPLTFSVDKPAGGWAVAPTYTLKYYQIQVSGTRTGRIVGLGDPVLDSDPVTKGWFESQDLGGGNINTVHVPDDTNPEPVEDPAEPLPDGTLWANPAAPISVPAVWMFTAGTATSNFGDGSYQDFANYNKMEFTAPGPGILIMHGHANVRFTDWYQTIRIWYDDNPQHSSYVDRGSIADQNLATGGTSGTHQDIAIGITQQPFAIAAYEAAGTSVYKFQGSASAGFDRETFVFAAYILCQWIPGAVRIPAQNPGGSDASQIFAPFARVKSANTWMPEGALRLPGHQSLDPDVTEVNVSTSTSLTGGGTQNGGSRTLTATVSPTSGGSTPVGSVQFKRGSTVVTTKTLSSGKATHSVSDTGSTTWTAVYLGGKSGTNIYQTSTSNSQSVTIRTLKSNTVTRNKNYKGLYPESQGYSESTYYSNDWRQGRYSGTWGNWKTMIGFTGVSGVSNLNSVKSVKLKIDIDHTYYGSGVDLDIGWHTKKTKPGTFNDGAGAQNKQSASKATGVRTITLNSWARDAVKRSDFGGIVLGSGSSGNLNHYGYGSGTLQLIIEYDYWS